LNKARLRRGKTLAEVSGGLKISPDYLAAIETGHFEELPGRVYAVGYVRSYAAYLGLDVASFVARTKEEIAEILPVEPVVDPSPPRDSDVPSEEKSAGSRHVQQAFARSAPSRERALQVMGAITLVSAVLYAAYHLSASAPPSSPFVPVPAQLAAEAGLIDRQTDQPSPAADSGGLQQAELPALGEVPPVLPAPETQLAAIEQPPTSAKPVSVRSNKEAAPSALEQAPPANKQGATPLPKEKPVAPSAADTTGTASAAVDSSTPVVRPTLSLGQHYGIRNKNSRITLRLHAATEVRVGGNRNQVFIDRTLDAGDTYRVPNISGLKLSAEDAGAVEIILDDTTIGFAGKDGVPEREISLDPKVVTNVPRGG